MKLWELRSYEQVIKLEQDRLVYQARLQARYGRNWRRKAPIESMMPLRLAKYGVPLADTAPAGLAAAGIEPALLPPVEASRPPAQLPYEPQALGRETEHEQGHGHEQARERGHEQRDAAAPHPQQREQTQPQRAQTAQAQAPQSQAPQSQLPLTEHQQPQQPQPQPAPQPQEPRAQPQPAPQSQQPQAPAAHQSPSPWFAPQKLPESPHASAYDPHHAESLEPAPVAIPAGPGRTRPLGDVGTIGAVPHPRRGGPREPAETTATDTTATDTTATDTPTAVEAPTAAEEAPQLEEWSQEDGDFAAMAFEEFSAYTDQEGQYPSVEALDIHLADRRDVRHPRSTELLGRLMPEFRTHYVPQSASADSSA